MLCREIISRIESAFPKNAACKWDNVGLLAGREAKEVRKIYVALDATDEVISDAASAGADMLITHHPLLFSPVKSITDGHFIGRRLIQLIQNDIAYYAMHTNYDILRMGEIAAGRLGLADTSALEVTMTVEEQGEFVEKGIGCVGVYEDECSLEQCAELVKEKFQLPAVRIFGDSEKEIRTIAIVPGSGKDLVEAAISAGADVLVTGDIGHHDGIDAVAQGIAVIDAGHYGLEHIYIEDMGDFLEEKCPGIKIIQAAVAHPYRVI